MYTDFYNLVEKPFSLVPDPSYLYPSSKHRLALTYLEYGLMDGIAFIVMTGEVGAGKTTTVRKLLSQIADDVEVAVISNTNVSSEQLLELILTEFDLEVPSEGKAASLNVLSQFLVETYSESRRALLVVDEAQNLPHEALEEIRMLSNLQTDKDSLLQILLVGQPALRSKLQHPSLLQLSQRIAVSYHLGSLELAETRAYIAHRLKVAGCQDDRVFTPEAVESVHNHSGGIPRAINILCDAALVYGYADELQTIDPGVIKQVVHDRQEVGLTAPLPTGEEIAAAAAVSPETESLSQRLQILEERVELLSGDLARYLRQNEPGAARSANVQVQHLEKMLAEERSRSDTHLAQLTRLREKCQQVLRLLRKGSQEAARKRVGSALPPETPLPRSTPGQASGIVGKLRRSLAPAAAGKGRSDKIDH